VEEGVVRGAYCKDKKRAVAKWPAEEGRVSGSELRAPHHPYDSNLLLLQNLLNSNNFINQFYATNEISRLKLLAVLMLENTNESKVFWALTPVLSIRWKRRYKAKKLRMSMVFWTVRCVEEHTASTIQAVGLKMESVVSLKRWYLSPSLHAVTNPAYQHRYLHSSEQNKSHTDWNKLAKGRR
jgi:hypothetical protein